jgi:Spy/CpxP family protein refolding chaperone
MMLWAVSFAAATALHAADVVAADNLSKEQLKSAIQAATDDTIIVYRGQSKTKAQWQSDFTAQNDANMAKLKELQDNSRAQFEAAAKALQDEQDKAVADQNAAELKAFNESR